MANLLFILIILNEKYKNNKRKNLIKIIFTIICWTFRTTISDKFKYSSPLSCGVANLLVFIKVSAWITFTNSKYCFLYVVRIQIPQYDQSEMKWDEQEFRPGVEHSRLLFYKWTTFNLHSCDSFVVLYVLHIYHLSSTQTRTSSEQNQIGESSCTYIQKYYSYCFAIVVVLVSLVSVSPWGRKYHR